MEEHEQQIQDITLSKSHIGRQVAVSVPGKPEWTGFITGWNDVGVVVSPNIQGDFYENIFSENLRWIM